MQSADKSTGYTLIESAKPIDDRSAIEAPWATDWLGGEGGRYVIAEVLAGFNPAEARRIWRECTWTQIGRAYKSKMAMTLGVGFKHPEPMN